MSQPFRGDFTQTISRLPIWLRMCLYRCLRCRLSRELGCAKVASVVATLFAIANGATPTAAYADSVRALISYGSLDATDIPTSYGVNHSSLFFSAGDNLYRLDDLNSTPEALALPPELGNGMALRASFTEFDGSLFMHARRRSPGASGVFLHRIRNRAGKLELIDIREEPDTDEFSWIVDRGYADDTREFAELDGKLYFFAARAIPPLDFINQSHALFRLNNADARPQQVLWEDYFNAVNPRDLAATSLGLVFRATSPGVARQGHPPQSYIYRIDNPQPRRTAPDAYQDFSIATGKRLSGRSGGRELIVFDNLVYYSGEHHGLKLGTNPPSPGPYPDPGRIKNTVDPVQIELYRHDPSSGNVYFDLHALDSDAANSVQATGASVIGSSSPDSFVTVNGAFYFRARSDGENADLYRSERDDPYPQRVVLNPDGPSHARPLGEFLEKLWLVADTGSGIDLHYLNPSDNTLVPLNTGESIARSARGFTVFRDHVIFTAMDQSQQWWTFAASIDGSVSGITNEKLATRLMVNGIDVDSETGQRSCCSPSLESISTPNAKSSQR